MTIGDETTSAFLKGIDPRPEAIAVRPQLDIRNRLDVE
jgi:hypothetical protein